MSGEELQSFAGSICCLVANVKRRAATEGACPFTGFRAAAQPPHTDDRLAVVFVAKVSLRRTRLTRDWDAP